MLCQMLISRILIPAQTTDITHITVTLMQYRLVQKYSHFCIKYKNKY